MFISLKSKVVGSFIVLVIIPILFGAYMITEQVRATELDQLNVIHTQMTKRVASELENYVKHNIDILRKGTTEYIIDYDKPSSIKQALYSLVMSTSNFDQILFLDGQGKEISHVHRYKILNIESHKDYSVDISYIYPKLNQSLYFGSITFTQETSEPVANVSFDIREPQTSNLIGVIIATIRLKPIWNLLANINVQKGQQIYILDSDGRLIAHPNPSLVLKNITYNIDSKEFTKGLLGDHAFVKYTKINIGNQFFTVVSEHKVSDALKLLNNITFVIIVVVISTITMCIILIILSIKHIVTPINHLSKVAKDIEAGNLNRVAEVNSKDEIGLLGSSFNKMTKKLKDNTVHLKEFNLGLQKKINSEIEKTRKMEQLLFEQKKFADMGQMINAIAHQWRQPLNNIGLIQQYLTDGFKNKDISDKDFQHYSDSLIEIVQNMSATIDDFRTFFTSNKQQDRFNLITSLIDFMKLTSAQLNSSNIKYQIMCYACSNEHVFNIERLTSKCVNKELEIIGPAGEFKQVLQNIIANARDAFIENEIEKPTLIITINVTANDILLSFRDNAKGIPEKIMPNIFDPYFTTKQEGKGTGIGLYISKVIIDDHFGGMLRAINVDGGAEFIIKLPKAPND